MKCRKGYSYPKENQCTTCEYFELCKLEQIEKKASQIENIKTESTNNIFDKLAEDNGILGCIFRIIIGLSVIFLVLGLLQMIFTSI